ncbi:MAG: DUF3500 domain-containing protein [Bryobacteraceae bacterium]|jgi:uncharacterized protein DUF3500
MKPIFPRLLAGILGIVLLTAAYHRLNSSSLMADAANRFLASLTPEQRAKATFTFEEDERQNWHFVPIERKGLALREMTPAQKHLATALLSAGLSQQGFLKAETVMSLEDVLLSIEHGSGPERDPEKYFVSIFGQPTADGAWGYRVEGHHLSQNYTVVGGHVAGAPSFFGANPAEVRDGPRKGLRTLGAEEDLGRAVIQSLDAEQRKAATVSTKAYPDIITMDSRQAALKGQPSGLQASKMTAKQFDLLLALLGEYANNMPEQIAQAREDQIKKAGKDIYFAWAGGTEKGDPHYYRVQTASFLIEYDDTQNNANHIHSVWRDFNGDFGVDLLKQHYQSSH